jgi:hypothetical protein
MSQNLQILSYLKTGQELTPRKALELFGCMRLAARVHDLRCQGWPIVARSCLTSSSYGLKRFAVYRLDQKPARKRTKKS